MGLDNRDPRPGEIARVGGHRRQPVLNISGLVRSCCGAKNPLVESKNWGLCLHIAPFTVEQCGILHDQLLYSECSSWEDTTTKQKVGISRAQKNQKVLESFLCFSSHVVVLQFKVERQILSLRFASINSNTSNYSQAIPIWWGSVFVKYPKLDVASSTATRDSQQNLMFNTILKTGKKTQEGKQTFFWFCCIHPPGHFRCR